MAGGPPGDEIDAATLQARLAAIVHSSDDAIIGKTTDGIVTSWNPAAERLYGYVAEEAVGRSIQIIEPPQRAGEIETILSRIVAGERIDHHETERLAKDGRLVEVSLTVSPIRTPEGRIVGASAIAREIGARRRAERYRDTLLAATSILAAGTTLEQAVPRLLAELAAGLRFDRAAMWLVGDDGDALERGDRWPPDADDAPEPVRLARGEGLAGAVWESGEPARREDGDGDAAIAVPIGSGRGILGVLELGSRRPLVPDSTLSELLRAVGAQVGGFLERISATEAAKQAREGAERASLAKSEFLSRMSHELRTPLNVVLGFAQLLELRGREDERDREAVESILKAGRHLLELINEVLDLSRIESGRMALSPEPVEVADLVGEALDLVRPLAQERSLELTAELDPCQRHVTADRQRLKQVLLNLLSNAIKYNRDGGRVAVSCAPGADDRLRLEVSDTGPGIPAAAMDRLFEPFERLGAERGRVEGTGLGLALSRQLVELMGGETGARSREGEGTTVWVELAVAEAPHTDSARPAGDRHALAAPSGHRRVLLVEDNLANLKLIEALVSERQHIELLPAMTGRLGLSLAREHKPDLILLDQHLPDLTGVEVLNRLKAEPETRALPVVVVSADATSGQIRKMLELGAADYLTKPLDVPRFLRVIDGIVDPGEPAS